MANNNGHITAPVNTDDVSAVLNVSSHDVRIICRSDKINPHSLIRPIYTTNPALGPEDMKDAEGMGAPDASGEDFLYELKSWGYYVPYVTNASNIEDVCQIPWHKDGPKGDSFDCLTHFDGYRHNANPRLPVEAIVNPGKNIILALYPGSAQSNALSSDGIANNGGVVGIRPVLGDDIYIGCTIVTSYILNQSYYHHFQSSSKVSDMIENIETSIVAEPGRSYIIIPWASNKAFMYINGSPVMPSGMRFYSLMFSDDWEGIMNITCPTASMSITNVVYTKTSNRLNFDVTVANSNYENPSGMTGQPVSAFKLTAKYAIGNEKKEKTVLLGNSTTIYVPKNESVTISLYTNDTEIVNNADRIYSLIVSAEWTSPTGTVLLQSKDQIKDIPSLEVDF